MNLIAMKQKIEGRIIKTTANCWEWQGAATISGYGIVTHEGKNYYTHRLMYEAYKEPIKRFNQVMHSCDNTKCCNPEHLDQGMPHVNMLDKQLRGRAKQPVGEARSNSKLTNELVRYIYDMKGKISGKVLAKKLNLGNTIIYYIWEHRRWTHITQPDNILYK